MAPKHQAMQWNGPQPAPRALWTLVHVNFVQTRFDGIYNRRNIAGTNIPSLHAEGRALDIGVRTSDPTEKLIGDGLFEMFVDLAMQMGLQEIIWNRQIWSDTANRSSAYYGQNPHTDHIHVGFTRPASQNTAFVPILHVRIAILRTGLEDLHTSLRDFA